MINLLPPDMKRQIRAARVNVLLRRYIIFTICAVLFLIPACGFFWLVLNATANSARTTIDQNAQKTASLQSIQTQATTFRTSLSTAKTIMGQNIAYSTILAQIAQALPNGVILNGLTLDPTTFGTPTTLTAQAKSYDDAITLKERLAANSELFTDVSLQTVGNSNAAGSSPQSGTNSDYPITITINVTIQKTVVAQ